MKKYTARKIYAGDYFYRGFNIYNQIVFGELLDNYEWLAKCMSLEDWYFDGSFKTLREAKAWVDEVCESEIYNSDLEARRERITKYHLAEGNSL